MDVCARLRQLSPTGHEPLRSPRVSETTDTDTDTAAGEPLPCSPCRGTGQLVSNKGGEPHTVTCPWCEGGGVELPGHDAQAARRAAAEAPA